MTEIVHSSFVIRHSEILSPIVLVGSAEQELDLLGSVGAGVAERVERGADLGHAAVAGQQLAAPLQPVHGSGNLQQLGPQGQEFLF
jgi:hypothetical protein